MTVYKISSEPTYLATPGAAPGVGIRIYASTRPPGPAPEPLPGLLYGVASQAQTGRPQHGLLVRVWAWIQAQPNGGTYYEAAAAMNEDPRTIKILFENARGKWLAPTPNRRNNTITDKGGNVQRRQHRIWIAIKQ